MSKIGAPMFGAKTKPGHTFHTVCSGCGQMHEIGTNCKCGYLSVADDAISVDDLPILGCMSYMGVSSDGKVAGWVCNNDHEHQGKIVVITHVMNRGDTDELHAGK
ncbi:hypothetical protein KKF61_08865 [Patescibacteria group bacterium]|nr:hypothetical protein [Patescibacteria group bacterium]